jgi:hypothetical protein
MCLPSLVRGTVVILSTIRREGASKLFSAAGSIASRNNGASVGSEVKLHTVTDAVASKRSSWTITTGRGLPAQPDPPAAVQTSPSPHQPSGADIASINAWTVASYGLLATAADCRCASAAKPAERVSGTQIWIGLSPCRLNRSR